MGMYLNATYLGMDGLVKKCCARELRAVVEKCKMKELTYYPYSRAENSDKKHLTYVDLAILEELNKLLA
ncbi:hypothetical protein HDV00_008821 [Rhizophlyctis rosea]|nr:hypothetical protein HDV00_008821 [Rhizophlyctis rosea]